MGLEKVSYNCQKIHLIRTDVQTLAIIVGILAEVETTKTRVRTSPNDQFYILDDASTQI